MESYGVLAVVFLIAGLVILVAEVFIPSGGILAILTSITLSLSLVMAYSAWYETAPVVWWGFLTLVILTIPFTLGGAFYVLPRTSVGRKILLEAPNPEDVVPFAAETARLEQLVGKFGVARTMLSPGGLVQVANQRLHAFTEGQLVEAGTPVEVLEVRGTRLLVRPGTPPSAAPSESPGRESSVMQSHSPPADSPVADPDSAPATDSPDSGSRIDFDFPAG